MRRQLFSRHRQLLLLQDLTRRRPVSQTSSAWLRASSSRDQKSSTSPSLLSRLGPEPSAIGYDDYEAERRTFKLEQPQFYNFASDVIDRWALTEQVRDDVITVLSVCGIYNMQKLEQGYHRVSVVMRILS